MSNALIINILTYKNNNEILFYKNEILFNNEILFFHQKMNSLIYSL
jgi:hypothetical protein